MVGIGGRSRGCKICRRARVKCDETRPICNRCARLKKKCEGSAQFPTFIDGLSHLEIQLEAGSGGSTSAKMQDISSTAAVISKPLAINKDYVFLTHLVNTLLTTARVGDQPSNIFRWVLATTEPNSQNHTSQLAIGAVAAAYYGKLHSMQQAIDQGMVLYSRILCNIRKDLLDREHVLDTEILARTFFLAIYELITSKDLRGCVAHFLGIGQLIKIRGPSRHQNALGKELFLSARCSIALAHLFNSKRCFLEEISWKVVPWANNPDSKSTTDYLVDVLCDMPGVLEDMRLVQNTPNSQENLLAMWTSLAWRLRSGLESLYRWRAKWEVDFANTYYPVDLDLLRDLMAARLELYPLSDAIFFAKPVYATELCLYNSILILFHLAWSKVPASLIATAIPTVPPLDIGDRGPNSRLLLAPGEGTIEEIVSEICRMLYYQILFYPSSTGILQLIFPLQVAYRNADPSSTTARWVSEIMAYVADVHGFEAAMFAQSPMFVAIIR